ncbi:alpha/beta fold hydrolase [Dactylosporangium sp. CA-092794]|uniref:alpha/beta fold hydrolase n=1 Tax=Dactylosporangium sp. CA-092794 TaxID=3239929 RepID=UPI003D8F116F
MTVRPELATVDGVPIAYRVLGSGPPAVLLHGGGPGCTAALDFGPVLDRLAAHRRLILVDLPQYGDSGAPAADGPAFGFHARYVRGLLRQLGVEHADFVCQSLGGSVAMRLAADRPGLVRRLVVTGSQPTADPAGGDPALGRSVRQRYYGAGGPSRDKMRRLLAELEWFDPDLLPESTVDGRYAASTTAHGLALGLDFAARGLPEDLGPALATVDAPVLLVWGAADPFAGPAYALALADRLPRADVAVLTRASHHPQEERPADYARLALAFLH